MHCLEYELCAWLGRKRLEESLQCAKRVLPTIRRAEIKIVKHNEIVRLKAERTPCMRFFRDGRSKAKWIENLVDATIREGVLENVDYKVAHADKTLLATDWGMRCFEALCEFRKDDYGSGAVGK